MQFLHPGMLVTLGLIPILILIHALKPKPRQMEVTNLFLWDEIFKERTSNVALKKLKKNLPLLLQILIILLTAFALAGPVWLFLTQKEGNILLIVDTSASMKTRLSSGNRFDLARKKTLDIIDQRGREQKILIVEAGGEATLKSGFIDNSNRAKDIIDNLMPSDAPGKLEKAVTLALSFMDPSRNDRVYLITDGAGADVSKLLEMHPKIVPVIISGGENNVGITKFEFRQELDRRDAYEIMVEIKNFNPLPVECPVRLSIDGTIIFKTRIRLGKEEKKRLIIPYSGLITGIAKAVLELNDDFTVDNIAYLSLSKTEDIWVLLVSKGNYFLEKLLASYPNMMINSVKEITPSSWEEQTRRHDIVIVDRMDFPLTDRGNFLLIDSYSPALPVLKTGRIDFPQILDWDKMSPLMANADIGELVIEQAAKLQADSNLKPVIESFETGLMYTYEAAALRVVVIGFDISRSNLPLKVAFPVMISNIINWLNPHKLHFSALHTRAGEPIRIYLDPQTTHFSIRPPQERWQKHQAESNPFTYRKTEKVGVYRISENNKRRNFTVNLVDESESDILGPGPGDIPGNPKAAVDSEEISAQQSLWMFLLLLGLAVLMMEWYVWLKFG